MMNKKEIFDLACEVYADLDAMHEGKNSEYVNKVKDVFYQLLTEEKTLTPACNYLVMSYYDGQASVLHGVFTTLDGAKVAAKNQLEDMFNEGDDPWDLPAIEDAIEDLDCNLSEAVFDVDKTYDWGSLFKLDTDGKWCIIISRVPVNKELTNFDLG